MDHHGNGFKEWALKEVAYWTAEIEELRGEKVGIDAEEYLANFLGSKQEPLVPALGGLPLSLKLRVDEDLQRFKDAGINVVFFFGGLDLACKDRLSILRSSAKAADTLDEAWRTYDAGRAEESVATFGKASTYRMSHIIRGLQAHLHERGIWFARAPYSAGAQLAKYEETGHISAIVGSASPLLHMADEGKIILSFDWEIGKFNHTDSDKCAEELGVSRAQLHDLFLLCGYGMLPTMPELEAETGASRLPTAKEMLKRANNDGYTLAARSNTEGYMMLFHKAKFAVKHATSYQPSFKEVNQVYPEKAPPDTHDFVSQRLPNELYWYLIRGLAGPRVLNWRVRQEVLETPPLDGGHSQAYKDLVNNKLAPLRSQSLVVITHLLHRYYQKNDVTLSCWFDQGSNKALSIPDNLASADRANYWHVTLDEMPASADSTGPPLRYAITALLDDAVAKRTVKYHEPNNWWILDKIAELRPNIVWRFLEHRGYIKQDHTLSPWGRALNAALQAAADEDLFAADEPANGESADGKPTDDETTGAKRATEIEEAIFMAFELVRHDCLNTRNMFTTPPYSGQPMRGSETDRQNVLLISRIACLAKLQHNAIGYTGPLSRHLLAYHQVAAAVREALRDLVEMHACNLFLGGSAKRQIEGPIMYTNLGFKLPFVNEPDAGLGLLAKSYLDEMSNEGARKQPMESVKAWFMHAKDPEEDLEKVWKLFEAINTGLQAADNSIVSADTKKLFKNAKEWLDQKLATP